MVWFLGIILVIIIWKNRGQFKGMFRFKPPEPPGPGGRPPGPPKEPELPPFPPGTNPCGSYFPEEWVEQFLAPRYAKKVPSGRSDPYL